MPAFDPTPYYRHVAQDLLARFGGRALGLADAACARLDGAGDDQARAIWRGVRAALRQVQASAGHLPAARVH
ncbi:MAG: hypothetical protein D6782_10450 [Alphaproteobacteria bacterium]|nr:MAG: hypothetical protein D6782_10450 [Alphaproteobacteria bacterium]